MRGAVLEVTFNMRLTDRPSEDDAGGIVSDQVHGAIRIRSLPKFSARERVRFLRPTAILVASLLEHCVCVCSRVSPHSTA